MYKILYEPLYRQLWSSGTKCDCKTDWLWVRSPLEEMKYLLKFIFPFLRSGVEAKRGVEFCHSTGNASRIPSAYPVVCGIQREADLFILPLYYSDSIKLLSFNFDRSVYESMGKSSSKLNSFSA